MISELHIDDELEPLSPKDTVGYALDRMNSMHLDLLPLVHKNKLINYVNVFDLEKIDNNTILGKVHLFATVLPYVSLNQHLLNALSFMKTLNLSLMAVLDENGTYMGVLKTSDLLMALSESLSIKSAGSIIVIRMKPSDYSLSDISRIIEYSDARILGLMTFEIESSNEIEIHLKLNTTSLKNVLATLERYDYRIVQYFDRQDLLDDLDSRYENLMKYIDN